MLYEVITALTLSPVMSARLLGGEARERRLSRAVHRVFDRLRARYERDLDRAMASRGPIYVAWIVVSLLALAMFVQSPRESYNFV